MLVRDVAYAQIPRAGRAEKHRLAADWIDSLGADRAEDRAEMLAHHYGAALEFARDHNVAFYDALILAAAIEAGCETLFSEDFQHGRRLGDCTIVNPFF